MGEMIAGHKFQQGPTGRLECVLFKQDVDGMRTCLCMKRWVNIRNSGLRDLGKPDIAHEGGLNQYELDQILAEAKAEDARIAHAIHDAAFSGQGAHHTLTNAA